MPVPRTPRSPNRASEVDAHIWRMSRVGTHSSSFDRKICTQRGPLDLYAKGSGDQDCLASAAYDTAEDAVFLTGITEQQRPTQLENGEASLRDKHHTTMPNSSCDASKKHVETGRRSDPVDKSCVGEGRANRDAVGSDLLLSASIDRGRLSCNRTTRSQPREVSDSAKIETRAKERHSATVYTTALHRCEDMLLHEALKGRHAQRDAFAQQIAHRRYTAAYYAAVSRDNYKSPAKRAVPSAAVTEPTTCGDTGKTRRQPSAKRTQTQNATAQNVCDGAERIPQTSVDGGKNINEKCAIIDIEGTESPASVASSGDAPTTLQLSGRISNLAQNLASEEFSEELKLGLNYFVGSTQNSDSAQVSAAGDMRSQMRKEASSYHDVKALISDSHNSPGTRAQVLTSHNQPQMTIPNTLGSPSNDTIAPFSSAAPDSVHHLTKALPLLKWDPDDHSDVKARCYHRGEGGWAGVYPATTTSDPRLCKTVLTTATTTTNKQPSTSFLRLDDYLINRTLRKPMPLPTRKEFTPEALASGVLGFTSHAAVRLLSKTEVDAYMRFCAKRRWFHFMKVETVGSVLRRQRSARLMIACLRYWGESAAKQREHNRKATQVRALSLTHHWRLTALEKANESKAVQHHALCEKIRVFSLWCRSLSLLRKADEFSQRMHREKAKGVVNFWRSRAMASEKARVTRCRSAFQAWRRRYQLRRINLDEQQEKANRLHLCKRAFRRWKMRLYEKRVAILAESQWAHSRKFFCFKRWLSRKDTGVCSR